jgi:hypothetical protein
MLTGRRAVILQKGAGIRPISMGDAFMRLTELYLNSVIDTAAAFRANGIQLGVGIAGGSESAVHALRAGIQSHGPQSILIISDQENAYLKRRRNEMLSAAFARSEAAIAWRYLHWMYGAASPLLYYDQSGKLMTRISVEEGGPQGPPLMPWVFANSMETIYSQSVSDLKVTARAVLDDFGITGPIKDAFAAYDRYAALCKTHDIILKPIKRRCLWPHNNDPPAELVALCRERGINLVRGSMAVLGVWLGGDLALIRGEVRKSVDNVDHLIECLLHPSMPTQIGLLLSRYCLLPQMNYMSRTLPPSCTMEGLRRFDEKIFDCVCRLLRVERAILPVETVHLITATIRSGGLGFRRYTSIAYVAFLASAAMALHTINIDQLRSFVGPNDESMIAQLQRCHEILLENGLRGTELIDQSFNGFMKTYKSIENVPDKLQKLWMSQIELKEGERVRSRWSSEWLARVVASQQKNASRFLSLIPNCDELRLDNESMRAAVYVRLGLQPVPTLPPNTVCVCQKKVPLAGPNAQPEHLLTCISLRKSTRYALHESVQRCVQRLSQLAIVQINITPRSDTIPKDQRRPDFSQDYYRTRIMSDVAVTHPPCRSRREAASKSGLAACGVLESIKRRSYKDKSALEGRQFIAFVVETLGGVGRQAQQIIRMMAREAEANHVMDAASFKGYAYNRLSIAIQRGVAECLRIGSLFARGIRQIARRPAAPLLK